MMHYFGQILRRYGFWLVIVLSVLPFVSLVSSPFVSDDWEFLYHAETLPYTAERIFGTNTNGHTTGGSYRPVVNLYWGTMYEIFGTSVVPYRISILLLQILAIVLVYQVVRRLPIITGRSDVVALATAACFAFFPGRVEALAWIAVINDTLLVPLLLASWLAYICYIERSTKWPLLLLSSLFFALALGTKEVAVTFPGILAATYVLFAMHTPEDDESLFKKIRNHMVRLVGQMLPYALVLLLFFLIRYQIIGFVTEDYTGAGFSLLQNNPIRSYISMFVATLLVDPIRTQVSLWLYQYQAIMGIIVLYGIGATLLLVRAKIGATMLILLSWYALAVFPASRFGVNMWQVVPSAEGERYTYYPSIFLAIAIAAAVVYFFRKYASRGIFCALSIACLIVYVSYATIGTIQKVQYWHIAAARSDALLTAFVDIQQTAQYEGVVVVGLPDALYGAFIWRNAFALTVAHASRTDLTFSDILTTPVRTVPIIAARTSVEMGQDAIIYTATAPIITSPPVLETQDYVAMHTMARYREGLSISYTDFTSGILLTPTPSFIEQNMEKHIGFFFFDGEIGWYHMPLISGVFVTPSL